MPKDALIHRPIQLSGSRRFRLLDLRIAMKYTECEFDRFRRLVWASAKTLEIKPAKRYDQVHPDVWDGLLHKCVEEQPKLNSFLLHWPIAAYFDRWNTARKEGRGRGRPRKNHVHEIPPIRTRVTHYIGKKPPPQKLISYNKENYRPLSQKFRPSLAPTLHSNDLPYDDADPQPCPICRSTPVLAAQHLHALFEDDYEAISGLGSIGVQTDLEYNMLLMLNEHERHELIRASSLSPIKKVSVKNKLKTMQPVVHVKPGISECEVRQYLAKLYRCEHHRQTVLTRVPPALLKLFNRKHIESLIPVAILLGMKTDHEYCDVFGFDEAGWDEILSENQMLLSPVQKAVLKSAFKTAMCD